MIVQTLCRLEINEGEIEVTSYVQLSTGEREQVGRETFDADGTYEIAITIADRYPPPNRPQ